MVLSKMKRQLFICLTLVIVVLLIAACGSEPGEENSPNANGQVNNEQTNNGQGEGSGAENEAPNNDVNNTADASGTREIVHAMGTTTVESKPERVVVLVNGMVDISLALDLKPVGAVESWVQQPWYEYLRDDMEGVQNLGLETQPDLEAIVELDPDLILGSKSRHESIYESLSDIAPTVMSETVYDWKDNMKLVAEATYRDAEAEAFFAEWDSRVADFKEKMGDRTDIEVSIINFRTDHARIYAAGYAGLILEELGFKRPENQRVDEAVISLNTMESIPQMDGDIIFEFVSDMSEGAELETQQQWKNHPLWQTLQAVQNEQVYQVNDITWNMSGGAQSAMLMIDDLYEIFELEKPAS